MGLFPPLGELQRFEIPGDAVLIQMQSSRATISRIERPSLSKKPVWARKVTKEAEPIHGT